MRTISLQMLTVVALLSPTAWTGGTHNDGPPVVTIANLRDNGVVHSGFVVGTAASGGTNPVAVVEVSLDGGATFQAATGTSAWKFKFPVGTAGWKDNSVHTVDVRAIDSHGNVGAAHTLSVRKGLNQDVDGDGFADVLVGAPSFDNNRGRVYLFYSSDDGSGIPSTADANNLDDPRVKVIGGEFDGPQLFGASIAVADVNGDGTDDLLVGAPGALNGAGIAYVFHSTPGVGPTKGNAINARGNGSQINGDGQLTLAFGSSISAGDVNGDGVLDVFAGAAANTDIAGFAFVFHATAGQGLSRGVDGTLRIVDANSTLVGAAGSFFGSSIAR